MSLVCRANILSISRVYLGISVHQSETMVHVGQYHDYNGVFSTLERYQEYFEGCSVHWKYILIHVGG